MVVSNWTGLGFNEGKDRFALGLWRLLDWQLGTSELRDLLERVLDLGIRVIDLADIYGDYQVESLLGQVLKTDRALRERLQLITKCGIKLVSDQRPAHTIKSYDTSAAHILTSVNHSLEQLQTDYLDGLLIHRPSPRMDADEIAEALTTLKKTGKVRYFGVSNFTPSQLELIASRLDFPLITNQVEISVLHTQAFGDGTLDQCQRLRISPMAWSPLGGGRLFGEETPQVLRLKTALAKVGEQWGGVAIDQVALAWLLSHPAKIIPVLGTGNLDRIRAAVAAETLPLTSEQWFTIWTASTGQEVP